jgi:hypothetical protein
LRRVWKKVYSGRLETKLAKSHKVLTIINKELEKM